MRCKTFPALLGLLASTILTQPVKAQQAGIGVASPAEPAADRSAAGSDKIEQVIVTAQRREESVKDVPYSVSAISGTELQDRHILNVEDITRETPGISFGAGANTGMDTITIRGVSSQGGGATVGLYLDDVPISTTNPFNPSYSGATEPKLFDLNRVEILRGPQGTLYGASSMGGTLRYISNQPDLDTLSSTVGADVSGTEHGGPNTDDSAVINVPLVPGVAAIRAGIDYSELSGYINHYTFIPPTQASLLAGGNDSHAGTLNQTGVNLDRTLAGRIALEYKPDSDLTVTASFFGQRYRSDDTSLFYPSVGLYDEDKLVAERSRDTMFVPSLTVTEDLGWADLTSISSYFWRQNAHQSDGTFFNSDFIEYLADFYYADTIPCACGAAFAAEPGPSITNQTTATTSEELRFASKLPAESGLPISWIGGLFLSDRKIRVSDAEYALGVRQTFIDLYGIDPVNSGFADPFNNDSVFWAEARDDERQYAGFGELSYNITPALKATAGLRYLFARTGYTYDEGGYFAQGIPPVVNLTNRYYATTPKFALDYAIDDTISLYANATKGYRLGGYIQPIQTTVGLCVADLQALGLANPGFSYGADKLWSYETGAKADLLDHHLTIDGAAYYIDWSNIQQTFDLSCGSPYTANFGSAESEGGELEIRGKPMAGLTLGLDAGVTHATLTKVEPNVGASVGQKLLNTPDWTATFSGEYDWEMPGDFDAFVRSDYDWVGRSHGAYSPSATDYSRPVYAILNASLGADFGRYEVSLYAKNLLDDQKIIQHVSIEELVSAYAPRPLTVGLNFTAKF